MHGAPYRSVAVTVFRWVSRAKYCTVRASYDDIAWRRRACLNAPLIQAAGGDMTNHTRREWLAAGACTALAASMPAAARAAMGPNDKFDLLVRNANVLDPSQNL